MQGRPLTAARPSGNGGAKLFTLLVVLLPLTYQIASPFPFLSLGELVLVPFVFVLLVTGIRDGVYSPAALSVFYLVPIGATFGDFFLYSGAYLLIADSFTVMARILFYYALIVVSTKYFAKDFALKCYWGAIVVLMAVLVAQLFAHYALGFDVPIVQELGPALFAPSQYADTDTYYHMYGFRPASLFMEPSHCNLYVAPMVAILLLAPKKVLEGLSVRVAKRRIVLAVLLTVLQLLTTGSGSILLCGAVWVVFFLVPTSVTGIGLNYRIIFLSALVLSLLAGFAGGYLDFVLERTARGATLGPRVLRGLNIIQNMEPIQMVFGVGLNNVANFVVQHSLYTSFDEANLEFTASLLERYITSGAIGFAALVYFFVKQFGVQKMLVQKAILILIVVAFAYSAIEYTYWFAFFFVLGMSFGFEDETQMEVKRHE